VYYTPSHKSEVNGQIERLHSTFLEIYRCLKNDNPNLKAIELAFIAVDRYNKSVYSVTNRKPVDIFFLTGPPELTIRASQISKSKPKRT